MLKRFNIKYKNTNYCKGSPVQSNNIFKYFNSQTNSTKEKFITDSLTSNLENNVMSKIKNLENKAMGGSLDKTKLNHNGIKFNNIPNLNTKKPHPMTNRSYEGTLVDYKLCDNTDLPEGYLLRRREKLFSKQ